MSISGRKASFSARALETWIASGRGSGSGSTFKPWHTTENTDTPSHSGKYRCELTQRYRHFLSDTEEGALYGALRDLAVTDAREDIRLEHLLTERICTALGWEHPRSTGAGTPLVPYTTDLLVTRTEPPKYVAISCATRKRLRKPSDSKSLVVEHIYWSLHQVPFLVLTDLEVTRSRLLSLRFLQPDLQAASAYREMAGDRERFFERARRADWSGTLLTGVRELAAELDMDSKEALEHLRALIWQGRLWCDLSREIKESTRNAVRESEW